MTCKRCLCHPQRRYEIGSPAIVKFLPAIGGQLPTVLGENRGKSRKIEENRGKLMKIIRTIYKLMYRSVQPASIADVRDALAPVLGGENELIRFTAII
jgi:hypothetical protein